MSSRTKNKANPFLRKAGKFADLPFGLKMDLLRLLPRAVVVEVAYRFLSLPVLSRLLGIKLPGQSGVFPRLPEGRQTMESEDMLRVLRAAYLIYPERSERARCLSRCLVVGWRFRSLEPVLQIGITRRSEPIMAHAWLEINGEPLDDIANLTPLGASRRHRKPGDQESGGQPIR